LAGRCFAAALRVFADNLPRFADILRNRNQALRSVPAVTNPTEVPEGPNLAITKNIRPPVVLRSAGNERSLKILGFATPVGWLAVHWGWSREAAQYD
jgi:hypothetical protein